MSEEWKLVKTNDKEGRFNTCIQSDHVAWWSEFFIKEECLGFKSYELGYDSYGNEYKHVTWTDYFSHNQMKQIRKYCNYGYSNKYHKPNPVRYAESWELIFWQRNDKYWNETKELLDKVN